jgi:methylmalonyl-CoA mutase N-terminal domain/subunit
LNAIRDAANKPNENLMPHLLDAVNAYATLQEMMDVLRKVWGEYREEAII